MLQELKHLEKPYKNSPSNYSEIKVMLSEETHTLDSKILKDY